ncbi:hypothetical protein EZV73_20885 [Acidaminobacter sp. JC074]|uniref:hypothetical protein n=1 Tax=Acidaminobacter sp. JC074 TaxID=2530199 RepID=UPI001F112B1E|nr:hypothetical protein [Acidaminobacter sp. JC074]MCH4890048.1 hypothetical protein [Acidaminobacter sp. JC074]
MSVLNKKGATSVLIILLMVVLMVFGLTILTTTLSNQSLSEKKQTWLSEYYDLESYVAIELASIDQRLTDLKEANQEETLLQAYMDEFDLIKEGDAYYYYFRVSEDAEENLKHIDVTLEIYLDKNQIKNYDIVDYSETQDLFEYEDIKFGNPFIPKD